MAVVNCNACLMEHLAMTGYIVRGPAPASAFADTCQHRDTSRPVDRATDRNRSDARVLLSQGMTRPGVVQGQHWGRRRRPPGPPCPVPESHADPRLSNPVVR